MGPSASSCSSSTLLMIIALFASFVIHPSSALNILQGNDDGWAECNIRTLYKVLKQRGHQTIISAPVRNKSGTGSRSTEWTPLREPGEYDTVPVGAPGVGHDPADPRVWYVNAFPLDGIRFGLDTLTARFYGGMPDLIVTGPNVGKNTGLQDRFSGTLGAAAFGSRQGVTAIAISADDDNRHGYQTGDSEEKSSEIYAKATMRVLDEFILKMENTAEGPPNDFVVPAGCVLNINLQRAGPQTDCRSAHDYRFVLTTIFGIRHQSGINHCGSPFLPGEQAVLDSPNGCWAAVTLIQSHSFLDGSSEQKQALLDRAPEFFSCPAEDGLLKKELGPEMGVDSGTETLPSFNNPSREEQSDVKDDDDDDDDKEEKRLYFQPGNISG
ncbi:hypothetical protein PGTUg99_011408 [Puccinia graminis f. sp. tritici]|uniref:Survival protein SurE-like phosphatase/nucleotidase domain-containing protein n=1 Tax=Puccinia graminis f. sp. tritici TaxID=56615 RepID=A0A5B0S378_PUCGR|nr:hypothetical protein PGTUg99_011408 [Puccinia graminis f. sp. tritici]KAA1132596.1 hypothetical protein PGTUg99_011408 [Puccinia graminis f. sp. tritici]